MPNNLYGPGDNYDLQTSHVLPALIRKMHEAKQRGDVEVEVWGTGRPRREFVHSEDMAIACVMLMNMKDEAFSDHAIRYPPLVNIGCGVDMTIEDLAELVAKTIGFKGGLRFDPSKPDGTPRKLLDVERLFSLGWRPTIQLDAGLRTAYLDYLQRQPAKP